MSRSTKSPSSSPPHGPASQSGDPRLPEGSCHYLLPQQELRGQRCGCVHFTLNRNIPSAMCICGHNSCFHTNEPYLPELEYLAGKLKTLQAKFDEQHEEKMELTARLTAVEEGLIARLSSLEEIVEKSREEASLEIKGSYQNLSRAWHSINELERQTQESQHRLLRHGEQIRSLEDEMRRLENRQLELNDADISLEERVEALEDMEDSATPTRHRRPSGLEPATSSHPTVGIITFPTTHALAPTLRSRRLVTSTPEERNLWTVHISLLPESDVAFPFERDTVAYQRCLSRGLHQMVVINGHDAEAFNSAVSKAFERLLEGRPWMPLQARLCNAESLQGLPMLRRLDDSMIHGRYDKEFLRRHCGVCDSKGTIDSLYIAMRFHKLSWPRLRNAPVYMPGLEACWAADPYLDRGGGDFDSNDSAIDDNAPSAGDIMTPTITNLKRTASEISRSSSFGSAAGPGTAAITATSEGEGSRPKVARVIPESRRRVETV